MHVYREASAELADACMEKLVVPHIDQRLSLNDLPITNNMGSCDGLFMYHHCSAQLLLWLVMLLLPMLSDAHADLPSSSRSIHVIGSVNADIFVPIEKFPEDGETILANDLNSTGMLERGGKEVFLPGGKGANSAVSASLLDAKTIFTGRFGSDANGKMLLNELQAMSVDTSSCKVVSGCPSGLGLVFLASNGYVRSIIVGGANQKWSSDYIGVLSDSNTNNTAVIMLQCEIPVHVNEYISKIAATKNIPVFQDTGGEDREMSREHMQNCAIISPNESELRRLTNMSVDTDENVVLAAKSLQAQGANDILVTLGSRGSIYLPKNSSTFYKEEGIMLDKVVDATGCGDSFRSAFCVRHFLQGYSVQDSLKYASTSAAIVACRLGAIPACATPQEIASVMKDKKKVVDVVKASEIAKDKRRTLSFHQTKEAYQKSNKGKFPLKFASRLNSFKDREAVLGKPSSGVMGWIAQAGDCEGLDLIDFNYPQHFIDYIPTDNKRRNFRPSEVVEEKTVIQYHNALQKAKLMCGSICLRFPRTMQQGAFTNPDERTRQKAILLTKEACEWAIALGTREVVVWSAFDGYDYPLQADYDVLWQRELEAFQEVCDAYPQIKISLEFKPTDENTRYFAVPSTGAAVKLVDDVNRDNFGLTLDFGHCIMAGENPAQSIALVNRKEKNKLFGIQLGDGHSKIGDEDGLAFGSVHPNAAFETVLWLVKTQFEGHIYFDTFPRNEEPRKECEYNIRVFKKMYTRAVKLLEDRGDSAILYKNWLNQDGMAVLEMLEKLGFAGG